MHYERLRENFRFSLELFSTAFPICRNLSSKLGYIMRKTKIMKLLRYTLFLSTICALAILPASGTSGLEST